MKGCSWILAALVLGATPVWADSLFTRSAADGGTLIAEKLARFEVGDIITVLVKESIDATTTANTNTKKESDVEAEAAEKDNRFFVAQDPGLNIFNPEELPNWGISAENEAKTTGTTKRKSTLSTSITCVVVQVFPNGNLLLEGQHVVTVNREDSTVIVHGMVRSKDVTPANTVLSTQLANAQISLKGKGPLWNNQRRGLFTKVLDWFSPF